MIRPDGGSEFTNWKFVEEFRRDDKRTMLRLGPAVADLVAQRFIQWYDFGKLDMMMGDAIAARLWMLLENERIRGTWRRAVFAQPGESRNQPSVLQSLQITDSNKARVLDRLRDAVGLIVSCDNRYSVNMTPGKRRGTWNFEVNRQERVMG